MFDQVETLTRAMEVCVAYKSFRFKAKTTWNAARQGVLSATGKPNIVVGSPPEFKGEPDNWAPEELLVGSVNTCILLTFLTLAQARGLIPARYESEAEGLLENVEGKYRITEVTVRPRITVKSEADIELTREIIEGAEAQCFMSNSVKAKVTVIPELAATQVDGPR
jgi:organic hydroperoxide reductase OsmC/OhrA